MEIFDGFRKSIGLAIAGGKSPWGGKGEGGSSDGGDGGGEAPRGDDGNGPRNPWLPGGGGGSDSGKRRSANIEDIFKNRGPEGPRRRGGGGPRGPNLRLPERPGGKSWLPVIAIGILALWLLTSSAHLIGPQEKAVVKRLGNYSRTLDSGLQFSLPFPIETVEEEDFFHGVAA